MQSSSGDGGKPGDLLDGCNVLPATAARADYQRFKDGTIRISVVLQSTALNNTDPSILLYLGPEADLSALPRKTSIGPLSTGDTVGSSGVYFGGGRIDGIAVALVSGTTTLETVTSPLSSEVTGRLDDLVFRTVSDGPPTDSGAVTKVVNDADCYALPSTHFDTTVPIGQPCASSADCGNNGKACSAATQKCVLDECSNDAACGAATKVCRRQYTADLAAGAFGRNASACYDRCVPGTPGTCAAGFDCVRYGNAHGDWACMHDGVLGPGADCQGMASQVTTGCVSGYTCAGSTSLRCLERCDDYATDPGCGAGVLCVDGACGKQTTLAVAAAKVGEPCSLQDIYCAADGQAYRGLCASSGASKICKLRCELSTTCATGPCQPVVFGGPGVCP
jgi:hypothetical protein